MSTSGSSDSSVGVGGKIAGREKSIGKISLNAVDPHKPVGSDQVPGVLLKSCSIVLASTLAKIFNGFLSAGYVPRAFKRSHISPLSNLVMFLEPKTLDPCQGYPLCRGS